ncbi:reverse transcriptase domain-containing protein [Tanacetum coccineum]
MPFIIKNARATYQRLVDKVFNKQIGRNLKAYVDDMVIKSTSEEGMLSDIQETFERFRSINMKLNPKKCSFGVEEGPFLGHLITKQGIKANPMKIKGVTELEQPRALKDIQSLNRKLAAISRFVSKGAERSLPFFKFVQALPTLTTPRAGETLTMYLAASKESINAMLFAKRSEEQIPIYFISRVLQGAKLNYPALEKLILALVHAARRLRRYFQAHTIIVPTDTLIIEVLTRPEKTGRVAKWAIELGEHDIIFLKRDERETPADFLPEIPFDDNEKKVKEKEVSDPSNEWKLYTDKASSPDGVGARLMLIDPAGKEYTYALQFEFETTNNKAEYEALLAELYIAQEMEIMKVAIFLDLQIMPSMHKEAAKSIQDCNKCKEQSAIWKAGADGAITVRSTTLLRNSQEETPFSLTYGSEAVVPIVKATDDRGRMQETTKKGKEIASIENAHYRNKLRKYHNTRNNYSNYIVGDFVLFPTSLQEQQGPHIISEVHKDGFYTLVNIADHSLIQKAKGTSLRKFYM